MDAKIFYLPYIPTCSELECLLGRPLTSSETDAFFRLLYIWYDVNRIFKNSARTFKLKHKQSGALMEKLRGTSRKPRPVAKNRRPKNSRNPHVKRGGEKKPKTR